MADAVKREWIEVAPGRKQLVWTRDGVPCNAVGEPLETNLDRDASPCPAMHVFGEDKGRSRWNTHGLPDRADQVSAVEDLGCDEGRQNWPDYVSYTDKNGVHREGPSASSVASKEGLDSYLKLTGQRVAEKGEARRTSKDRLAGLRKRVAEGQKGVRP